MSDGNRLACSPAQTVAVASPRKLTIIKQYNAGRYALQGFLFRAPAEQSCPPYHGRHVACAPFVPAASVKRGGDALRDAHAGRARRSRRDRRRGAFARRTL